MRKMMIALFILSALLAKPAFGQETPPDPWQKLESKKGWILLYLAKASRDPQYLWLKRKHTIGSMPNFDIVGATGSKVEAGDILILKNHPSRIDIVDYANFRETKVEEIPPTKHLPWQKSWETGVYLPVGEKVRVLRVEMSPIGPGNLRLVYALISPVR